MKYAKAGTLSLACVLVSLALHVTRFPCYAVEPPEAAGAQQAKRVLNTEMGFLLHNLQSVAACEAELSQWANGRAYERLAIAEGLLASMTRNWKYDDPDYKWKPGTDDLSLPAGRAKWALEQLLHVKLSVVVDRSLSQDDLKKLHSEAACVVEAYRQGIMALAVDIEPPAERPAGLKRRDKAKIVPGTSRNALAYEEAMLDLLGEWPPIGRKYADLVSIIGAEAENQDYGLSYVFKGPRFAAEVYLSVKDGIIHSLGCRPVD
jgi:hypothetical protein